jgi:hypothetical protein
MNWGTFTGAISYELPFTCELRWAQKPTTRREEKSTLEKGSNTEERMSPELDKETAGADIAVEFRVGNAAAAEAIKKAFEDDEVLESHAFSGAEILTVLTKITLATIGKLFGLAAGHEKAIRSCTIKVGPKEVVLSGFTATELERLMTSGDLRRLVREVRK